MMKYTILFLLLPILGSAQQISKVTISGTINDSKTKVTIPFGNIQLKTIKDSTLIAEKVTDVYGQFKLTDITSGKYMLTVSYMGYKKMELPVLVGMLSAFLDLGNLDLEEDAQALNEIKIFSNQVIGISNKMDKKTFSVADNMSQEGGSVLQVMKNLPGVSTTQDGKLELRGSDKVAVLIDGKQTAITGFGGQTGLDNIPASAIERIEIINNPSAKFDANGNAGIINIIYKKNKQEGFNGKAGLTAGLGALGQKKENLPGIRPQYQNTPKINPSLSLNYRKNKINTFFQGDWLYTQTLNRNEFAERTYDTGEIIRQQVKRNRITTFATAKAGLDWNVDERNTLTVTVLFNREKITDRGDIPYFNQDLTIRSRLWQFLEDEVKYTTSASAIYQHNFKQAGHTLNASFNYTFHREDEKYFFTNIMPTYIGEDSFKLLSDEQVADLNVDYVRPLKHGRVEGGLKFRRRTIPVNMQFFPGLNSPVDISAGGWADYSETIPALYTNYVYENNKFELEAGLRVEYVKIAYKVNPNHNTYKSEGYDYAKPFPNLRIAYKLDDKNKISLFYTRRVDRPNEVDIRIFPKYDEPEVIKVGNPALRPQFTNSLEFGYKNNWDNGYFYSALYHRITDGTITRIATQVSGSTLIYNVFQNAERSYNSGVELIIKQDLVSWVSVNANANVYQNTINAFQVENKYPVPVTYRAALQKLFSGNLKINGLFHLPNKLEAQLTGTYLAPDIIPQGRISSRYTVDLGIKKLVQKGAGELFLNATDLFNTLKIQKEILGNGFKIKSTDYYETQVFRIGYTYKF
ncbi:TonB-dependent receptor [Pedobacter sp. UYP1]|uniref:TonB-dependent receptor domain-containing protein n=1 Tax=Pedobacter sp. UYP1 TaxID=1756396 RepID=UPI00339218FC